MEQLKKDYQIYQQEDVADAKVQKFEGIKVDPKNKFYYTDLTGDRSLSFSINQGKIAGIFMHINSEHSAYVYYSGVID